MKKTHSFALVTCLLAAATGKTQQVQTVFVIALENHNWTQPGGSSPAQLFGNAAAPYINSLVTPGNANATMVSFARNYENVAAGIHPSEPNYIWSEAGTNFGILDDNDPFPSNAQNTTNHLCGYLQALGISWRSYQEDTDLATSGGQYTNTPLSPSQYTVPLSSFSGTSSLYTNAYNNSHDYAYAAKHNPQVFFIDTDGGNNPTTSNPQASYYAPLQQLFTDLANNTYARFNWITPDLYNDMHTPLTTFLYHGTNWSGDQAAVAEGDNFLSIVVPQIMASPAFQNNGVIVIWEDETEGGDSSSYTMPEIIISPLAKGNAYSNTIKYTHSSDLKTWQEVFGVGPNAGIGDAANATDLSDLFKPGAFVRTTAPSSYSLFRGVLVGGNLASLAVVDQNYLQAAPGPTLNAGEQPLELVVNGTSPFSSVANLQFTLTAHGASGTMQEVDVYNWTTSSYQVVSTQATSMNDSTVTLTLANPNQFIQSGTNAVRARIQYQATGPTLQFPWNTYIDRTAWIEIY